MYNANMMMGNGGPPMAYNPNTMGGYNNMMGGSSVGVNNNMMGYSMNPVGAIQGGPPRSREVISSGMSPMKITSSGDVSRGSCMDNWYSTFVALTIIFFLLGVAAIVYLFVS